MLAVAVHRVQRVAELGLRLHDCYGAWMRHYEYGCDVEVEVAEGMLHHGPNLHLGYVSSEGVASIGVQVFLCFELLEAPQPSPNSGSRALL